MPRVLNKRRDEIPPGAVYVGRPTKWGNPFPIGPEYTREEAVACYRDHVHESGLIEDIGELTGKDLVCWCYPLVCHAQVLLELANE